MFGGIVDVWKKCHYVEEVSLFKGSVDISKNLKDLRKT
jgi:hypothetical protein